MADGGAVDSGDAPVKWNPQGGRFATLRCSPNGLLLRQNSAENFSIFTCLSEQIFTKEQGKVEWEVEILHCGGRRSVPRSAYLRTALRAHHAVTVRTDFVSVTVDRLDHVPLKEGQKGVVREVDKSNGNATVRFDGIQKDCLVAKTDFSMLAPGPHPGGGALCGGSLQLGVAPPGADINTMLRWPDERASPEDGKYYTRRAWPHGDEAWDQARPTFTTASSVRSHDFAVAWHATGRVLCPDLGDRQVGDQQDPSWAYGEGSKPGFSLNWADRTLSLRLDDESLCTADGEVLVIRLPDEVDELCAAASLLRKGDEVALQPKAPLPPRGLRLPAGKEFVAAMAAADADARSAVFAGEVLREKGHS